MTTKYFNVKNGLSAGNIILDAGSGNLSTVNITVTNISNLGNISNVIITGGTSGYVLQTNGSGNLSWAAPGGGSDTGQMPYYIPSGTTYTVQENRQGLFSIPITVDGDLVINGILVQV